MSTYYNAKYIIAEATGIHLHDVEDAMAEMTQFFGDVPGDKSTAARDFQGPAGIVHVEVHAGDVKDEWSVVPSLVPPAFLPFTHWPSLSTSRHLAAAFIQPRPSWVAATWEMTQDYHAYVTEGGDAFHGYIILAAMREMTR